MTRVVVLVLSLAVPWALGSAQVIQEDYLTPAEVEKVRDTREPNKRAELFLEFAKQRLTFFQQAWFTPPDQEPTDPDDLEAMANHYIRAVDDTAETIEVALERGGADLDDTRESVTKVGQDFLARLDAIQQFDHPAKDDLRWDLEEAVMATEDLVALAKQIPEGFIPPKGPAAAGQKAGGQQPGPPGRPTLKRPEEKEDNPPR